MASLAASREILVPTHDAEAGCVDPVGGIDNFLGNAVFRQHEAHNLAKPPSRKGCAKGGRRILAIASIPELLRDHVTLEVECLDRLYLNGYIGPLATSGGLVIFLQEQLGKPVASPVLLMPFPLRTALDRVDVQLDELIYDALRGQSPQRAREGS